MQLEEGKIVEGKVDNIAKFGAFVDLGENKVGLVHISEIAPTFVKEVGDYLEKGQTVKVKILNLSEDGKIGLSIKQAMIDEEKAKQNRASGNRPVKKLDDRSLKAAAGGRGPSFEYLMSKFKAQSDETQNLLNKRNGGRSNKENRR